MKIINVIGGLGNQMFQYAFAASWKASHPEEKVYVDTQHYKNAFIKVYHGNNFYHNGYEIDKVFPNASIKTAGARDLMKVSIYMPNQILAKAVRRYFPKRKSEFVADQEPYIFLPEALEVSGDCYFDGYWMSPLYFDKNRDFIIKEYEFKPFDSPENIEYEKLLRLDNSITIHIRRGDYVGGKNLGGICTLSYYRRAIAEARKIVNNPIFFVFSNDQEWCLENLKYEFADAEVHFVTNNKGTESYRDMQLMSLARCTILANSSFSWWGAYLNQRKDHITYCPDKWHNFKEHKDHYLEGWIKISTK